MAGSEEQNPSLNTQQLVSLIKAVNRHPIERDTVYNVVQDFALIDPEHQALDGFLELPVINNN